MTEQADLFPNIAELDPEPATPFPGYAALFHALWIEPDERKGEDDGDT